MKKRLIIGAVICLSIMTIFGCGSKKSEKKVMSMFDSGVTVLFVSHSLDQVKRICNKAMILDHGKLIAFGEIDDIASVYEKMIEEREKEVPKKKIKKSTAKKE